MSTPTYSPSLSTQLIERSDSGVWEIGTLTRRTQILEGKLALAIAAVPGRGWLGSGSYAGWIVDSATLTPDKGRAVLVIRYSAAVGSSGVPLPEDEWRVEMFEDNPRLERHPRYSGLSASDLEDVQTALQSHDDAERASAYTGLSATGKELVDKIRKGQESYYRAAARYSWTESDYVAPPTTIGGYIESPYGPGAPYVAPSYSWLRLADSIDYLNGLYRTTRVWLGGPSGHWDADIYASP